MKINTVLFTLLVISNSLWAKPSLCKKNEYEYFSCELTNNKIMSFCSPSENSDKMSYRYGKANKIEINYTKPISTFGILNRHRGEITKSDQEAIAAGSPINPARRGDAMTISFSPEPYYIYNFEIKEFNLFPGEKAKDNFSSDTIYTRITDNIFMNTFLIVENIHGKRFFEGECKQANSFQNLFNLKENDLPEFRVITNGF